MTILRVNYKLSITDLVNVIFYHHKYRVTCNCISYKPLSLSSTSSKFTWHRCCCCSCCILQRKIYLSTVSNKFLFSFDCSRLLKKTKPYHTTTSSNLKRYIQKWKYTWHLAQLSSIIMYKTMHSNAIGYLIVHIKPNKWNTYY